ncbi:MAG: Fatty acid cis/trans isomerase, partial [Proteobacteria bacterium]|nr:Fatty acid cis/trans isomerase [Pseudomonadota bacterium]
RMPWATDQVKLRVGLHHRLAGEDSLLVAKGFIGAYPNAFFRVPGIRLAAFVKRFARNSITQRSCRTLASAAPILAPGPTAMP